MGQNNTSNMFQPAASLGISRTNSHNHGAAEDDQPFSHSEHRRRRRHSMNATSGAHSHHHHQHGSNTHMSLYEILNHMNMGQPPTHDSDDPFGMVAMTRATPRGIVESLPVRTITQEQINAGAESGADEGCKKCMVCLIEYEADEELRTMPCMHFFHKECIDKWLLERGSTCPVCNFNVRKDYNVTSSEQIATTQTSDGANGYVYRFH